MNVHHLSLKSKLAFCEKVVNVFGSSLDGSELLDTLNFECEPVWTGTFKATLRRSDASDRL